jgi:hypothetical protein
MKHLVRISSLSIIVFIISLFITVPVLAIPPLPSSFYGTVKVNNANVPDGTVIQALVGEQVYAEGFTQTYQGNSVYALDVQGDNTDTTTQDGARDGDALRFKIGGVLADQTAVWHTGTNISLNLTASSSGPIIKPQATHTPVPTQTAIVLIQPSQIPTKISQASLTPISVVRTSEVATQTSQASQIATQPAQPSQIATQPAQPSQIATQASQPLPIPTLRSKHPQIPFTGMSDKDNGLGNISGLVIFAIILILAVILGYLFLTLRKKKM